MKKKGIVENDKTKIEQVIAELDEKKNEALKKAFEKVNIVSKLSYCFFWLVLSFGRRWNLQNLYPYFPRTPNTLFSCNLTSVNQ